MDADRDGRRDGGTVTSAPVASPATDLPRAEDVSGLPGALRVNPYPDFALAADDLVWVGNAQPGIVGYDPTTGEPRVEVATGRIKVAMAYGFRSLWAVEVPASGLGSALLRIEPATGEVLSRTPTGIVPNSSIAVTEQAVWAISGLFEESEGRSLTAFDSDGAQIRSYPAPSGAAAVRGGFGSLWVSSQGGVVRIDPTDGSTEATVDTGRGAGLLTVTDDAVWVLNTLDGTVSRIDPDTDHVVATVTVSERAIARGEIAAADGSIWVRLTAELAAEIDAGTNEVVRVLGPADGQGGIAVAEGVVWITASTSHVVYRVPAS